jgi:hypothetical protein
MELTSFEVEDLPTDPSVLDLVSAVPAYAAVVIENRCDAVSDPDNGVASDINVAFSFNDGEKFCEVPLGGSFPGDRETVTCSFSVKDQVTDWNGGWTLAVDVVTSNQGSNQESIPLGRPNNAIPGIIVTQAFVEACKLDGPLPQIGLPGEYVDPYGSLSEWAAQQNPSFPSSWAPVTTGDFVVAAAFAGEIRFGFDAIGPCENPLETNALAYNYFAGLGLLPSDNCDLEGYIAPAEVSQVVDAVCGQ